MIPICLECMSENEHCFIWINDVGLFCFIW